MNIQHYVAGFNASGHRVVTILCEYDPTDPSSESLLKADKEKAAKLARDATVIELIDQATFEQYMSNCVRDMQTGKPVPYIPPEPTAEEKQAAELSKLDSEYAAKLEDNSNQIIVAATVDQDEEYADQLRQERQALQDEYVQKRSEL